MNIFQVILREPKKMDVKIGKIHKEKEDTKKENEKIKKITEDKQQSRISKRGQKKKTVIIQNYVTDTNNLDVLKEGIRNLMAERLEIDVKTNSKLTRTKNCLVKLDNEQDKVSVVENKSNLKQITFINND